MAVPGGHDKEAAAPTSAPQRRGRGDTSLAGVSVRPGRTYPPPAPHGAGPELAELGARADSRTGSGRLWWRLGSA